MHHLTHRTALARRSLQRAMATAATRIGDQKVAMSLLEPNVYINYQRIEDNLAIVRQRCISYSTS
jgi:aconitate hydratase